MNPLLTIHNLQKKFHQRQLLNWNLPMRAK